MWISGSWGSTISGIGASAPSSLRWWTTASRARMSSVSANAVSPIPSGSKIRSRMTSPRRRPRTASTTRPHQSMFEPYIHRSPGSNSSGVVSAAFDPVITLG